VASVSAGAGLAVQAPESSGRRRTVGVGLLLLGLLALAIPLSAQIGSVTLPPDAVFAILLHEVSGGAIGAPCGGVATSTKQCSVWVEIVWGGRMPSIAVAVFAGAALALSGGTLQGVFRNPLSDPYLLGLSSGAALGASVLLTFQISLAHQAALLPIFAFGGALVPGMAVYVAASSPRSSPQTLVLTGVALAALFSAMLATFLFYNPAAGLQLSFWLLGNLQAETWARAGILGGAVLAVGAGMIVFGRELNILQLGPDVAESVGVSAARTSRRLILLSTLVTAVAVAFTGVIGFVGLVSPHVVRRLIGPNYQRVLPISALFGALFLVVAWDFAQEIIPPIPIPVGIPTSFVGAPFFLYLLYRGRGRPG
jgi:iron complex transport system permease protein